MHLFTIFKNRDHNVNILLYNVYIPNKDSKQIAFFEILQNDIQKARIVICC